MRRVNGAATAETFDALFDEVFTVLHQTQKDLGITDLSPFGLLDAWGGERRLEVGLHTLEMLSEPLIGSLRLLLSRYPGWEIVVNVFPTDDDEDWPDMALYIRADLIIDGLQRQYFPPEHQSIRFTPSRPGGEPDSLYPNYNPEFERLKAELKRLFAAATARMGLPVRAADPRMMGTYAGRKEVKVPVSSLRLLEPEVVAEIKVLLAGFKGWQVVLHPGLVEPLLPVMLLVVRHDGVLDGLVRSALPDPWRTMRYPDSRPLPE